jgi:glutamine amidotransferase
VIDVIDYRAGNSPSVIYALERLGLDCRRESELLDALAHRVQQDGVPFLGICIGLQVLFEHSEEGNTSCLGWLPGRIRRFADRQRVPQIGWNEVRFTRSHPVTAGLPDPGHYYFVNSYYAAPAEPADALGHTEYGVEFASVVAHDNIVATQFHAEKSGRLGLRLLADFATWDGRC